MGKNTCQYHEKRETRTNDSTTASWGDSQRTSSVVYEDIQGSLQQQSSVKYEVIKKTVPSPYQAQGEEINYARLKNSDGLFIKSEEEIWIRTGQPAEEAWLEDIGLDDEQLKDQTSFTRENDEIRDGRECWVVSYVTKPELFEPFITELVKQNLSGIENDETMTLDYWRQVANNMEITETGKTWIEKTSGLEIHEESNFTMKLNASLIIPDTGGNTIKYSYSVQELSRKDYYNWGKPIVLPDLSRAISLEKYDAIMDSLNNARDI